MARDTWQQLRPVVKTEKIRKSITIPAASFNCGSSLFGKSVYFNGAFNNYIVNVSLLPNTAFTMEAWIHTNGQQNGIAYPVFWDSYEGIAPFKPRYLVTIENRLVVFRYTKGGIVSLIPSINQVSVYDWTHIAVSWDGVTVKIFINGILDNSQAVASPVDAPIGGSLNIGVTRYLADSVFVGNIAELRLWNYGRTEDQIYFSRFSPRDTTGILDTGLVHYFKMSNVVGTDQLKDYISGFSIFAASPGSIFNDTITGPPLNYGASFIVAKYLISLGKKVSLVFPSTPPDSLTGQFCVSWTDTDGIFQRRKLWTTEGVDIAPELTLYEGEPLSEDFTLEFWNIDGQSTAVIPSNIVFYISDTTDPTTSYDHTAIASGVAVADSTLAQNFPWVFPLTFNSQQTYPS